MAYILNLETATKNCSVALAKNGELVMIKEIATEQFSHAEKLHLFIHEILNIHKITYNQLSAIAISKGPGSYTGLRIGTSTAKGLCYALNIPLLSIDTLELLARQIQIDNGIILPMIDARRMEVYSSIFSKNYEKTSPTIAEIITENSYKNIVKTIHLVGDGIEKLKTTLVDDKFIFHSSATYPSAKEMCSLSYKKYITKEIENTAYFEPYYLKDFKITQKQKHNN